MENAHECGQMRVMTLATTLDAPARRLRQSPRDPAFVQDPYALYQRLHASTPVVFWEDYGHWCVASYSGVNGLLRDRRLGRERPGGYLATVGERPHLAAFDKAEAGSMLELEPPAHTRLRTLVNRAFVSRQIERLRPRAAALANELIDRFESRGEAELIGEFATPLPVTLIAEMLGVPAEEGPQLVAWSNAMVQMYTLSPTRMREDAANTAARDFSAFVRDHAARKRREPADDLLSVLVSANEAGDRLSEDELVSSVILLLNAGHEATVHQTGNAIRLILAQGGDPRRFVADAAATAATVEECLRRDAPLHMFTRYAYEPVEIAEGVRLEAGEMVGLLLGAANTDPLAFGEPMRFDPSRPDQKNVSFGAGIHFCIGAPLARLEMQESLGALFNRLPGLAIESEPAYRDVYHFHGLERLTCRW
jgi:cytochrome P450